jgi:hypothetical protein
MLRSLRHLLILVREFIPARFLSERSRLTPLPKHLHVRHASHIGVPHATPGSADSGARQSMIP